MLEFGISALLRIVILIFKKLIPSIDSIDCEGSLNSESEDSDCDAAHSNNANKTKRKTKQNVKIVKKKGESL